MMFRIGSYVVFISTLISVGCCNPYNGERQATEQGPPWMASRPDAMPGFQPGQRPPVLPPPGPPGPPQPPSPQCYPIEPVGNFALSQVFTSRCVLNCDIKVIIFQISGMWYEIMTSSERPSICNQYRVEESESIANVTVTQFNPTRNVVESFAMVFNETNTPNGTFQAHRRDMGHNRRITVALYEPDKFVVLANCEMVNKFEVVQFQGKWGRIAKQEPVMDIRVLAYSREIGFATVQALVEQIESHPALRGKPLRSVHHVGCSQKGANDEFITTEAPEYDTQRRPHRRH